MFEARAFPWITTIRPQTVWAGPDRDVQPPMSTGSCTVQTIHTYEELFTLAGEWQALEVAAGTNVPFQTWEWSTSWWRHLHEDSSGVRDFMRVCVVRAPSGDLIG